MPGPSNKAMYSYKNGYMFYGDGKGSITLGNDTLEEGFFRIWRETFEGTSLKQRNQWTYELPLELLL